MTKHEAVAFAEWLAVTYGDRGIGASVVCPLGVATPLLLDRWRRAHPASVVAASGAVISAEDWRSRSSTGWPRTGSWTAPPGKPENRA